jgi:hypothetical protein
MKKLDIRKDQPAHEKERTFSILERVPVYLETNRGVWDYLESKGSRQLVIDDQNLCEAFMATVVPLELFGEREINGLDIVLTGVREKLFNAEQSLVGSSTLAKDRDAVYSELKEWIVIRGLLVNSALRPANPKAPVKGKQKQRKRVLLLISV